MRNLTLTLEKSEMSAIFVFSTSIHSFIHSFIVYLVKQVKLKGS